MWPEGLLMPSKEALWRFVTFDWLFSLYSDSVLPLIMIISVCFVFLFVFVLYMISSLIRPKPLKLDRAHVLVTGGSREIGKSIAIECIKQGALVTLVVYSDEDKLEQVKEDVEKYAINDNQEVLCFSVEVVNNYNKVESVVRLAQEKLGPVDMLVNCAGMSMSGTFEELSVHHFLKLIDVNYLDSVYATHIVIGGMKERKKGRVVFLCSQAGQLGLIGHTAYSASKFALRGLAEALQMEVKPYNVYVTVAYLPDLHMPSLAEDNKPFETKQISELSEVYQPECVAKVIVKDAVHGNFSSSIGPDGYMLSVLTCGMSPITSITEGLLQILIMGLFRSVALIYLSISDSIIHRKMIQKEQSKISDKSE